jgi:hypothetical protein
MLMKRFPLPEALHKKRYLPYTVSRAKHFLSAALKTTGTRHEIRASLKKNGGTFLSHKLEI